MFSKGTIEFRLFNSTLHAGEIKSYIQLCMKINAVLFQEGGTLRLGYDVYVKDSPGSSEWICFDCPSDCASLKEQDMLAVLDRIVTENGLSYTECCFERLEGILPPDKKI